MKIHLYLCYGSRAIASVENLSDDTTNRKILEESKNSPPICRQRNPFPSPTKNKKITM